MAVLGSLTITCEVVPPLPVILADVISQKEWPPLPVILAMLSAKRNGLDNYKVLKLQRAVNVYNYKAMENSEYLQYRDQVVIIYTCCMIPYKFKGTPVPIFVDIWHCQYDILALTTN